MNRMDLLATGWNQHWEAEGWYPTLREALDGLTAEQASWRPDGEAANTIWEIARHLLWYKEQLLVRIRGEELQPVPRDNDGTFRVEHGGEEAWKAIQTHMEQVHLGIQVHLNSQSDERYETPVRRDTLGDRVFNLMLHDAYHIGQIILTRKLQGSWPDKRSFE